MCKQMSSRKLKKDVTYQLFANELYIYNIYVLKGLHIK